MSTESEKSVNTASGEPSTPKKNRVGREKQKHRKQKYRSEWERDPLCLPWLGPDLKDSTKAIFKWCNLSLVADIVLIQKHKDTNKHLKELRDRKTIPSNAMQASKY